MKFVQNLFVFEEKHKTVSVFLFNQLTHLLLILIVDACSLSLFCNKVLLNMNVLYFISNTLARQKKIITVFRVQAIG